LTASKNQPSPFTNAAIVRNFAEYALIAAVWMIVQALIAKSPLASGVLIAIVILLSFSKTAFFGLENLQQLLRASRDNLAYHRFLMLMLINMSQITLSFGLDYHCLHSIDAASFSSIDPTETMPEQIFDFTYFSILNFTFFGYGDITPQTIPAKLMTITEIVLAFVTVIFLLSDFISMKESIRSGPESSPGQRESSY
jgi:Ion channel